MLVFHKINKIRRNYVKGHKNICVKIEKALTLQLQKPSGIVIRLSASGYRTVACNRFLQQFIICLSAFAATMQNPP